MENKLSCEVVEDLLPSYIEHLTHETTNKQIEEHLTTCQHCQDLYQSMTSATFKSPNKVSEPIDYLKKIHQKRWQSKVIIIILVCVCLGMVVLSNRHAIIMNSMTASHFTMQDDTMFYDDIEVKGNYIFPTIQTNSNHYYAYGFQFDKSSEATTLLHLEIPRQETIKVYFAGTFPLIVPGTLEDDPIWPTFIVSKECFWHINYQDTMLNGLSYILDLMGDPEVAIGISKNLGVTTSYNLEFQDLNLSTQQQTFLTQLLFNYANVESITFLDDELEISSHITKDDIDLYKIENVENFDEFLDFYHHFMD